MRISMPFDERHDQDVLNRTEVPEFSALANAPPSRLILVGVWMIFGPMALFGLFAPFVMWPRSRDVVSAVLTTTMALGVGVIAILILWQQTRRYRRYLASRSTGDRDAR